MLRRLQTSLAQVKTRKTSENLHGKYEKSHPKIIN